MGARGGAGSSTIAHNVGWLLSDQFQEEVSIIDLDITFGTTALAFNIETQQHIDQALADPSRLDDVLLDRFLVEYDENLRLLVAPATLNAEEKIVTDSLDRLLDLVRRRSSFVILDVPHRWAPWVQQVLLDADETVITGVLDLSGLRDTRNLVERLKQQRGESGPVRVVLNHAGAYKRTELSPKDFENALEVEPDLVMPHDPVLFGTAGNNGQMIGEFNPRHKAVDALRQFALSISARQPAQRKKKSMFDNLGMLKLKRA
jgi:pilus assembly protein CpaE